MKTPKDSRRDRIRPTRGSWTFVSNDLGNLISSEIIHSSAMESHGYKNQVPIYLIPLLLSFLRTLAVEIESNKERFGTDGYESKLLNNILTKPTNEVMIICGFYRISKELKSDAELLNHVRHEIIHPSPFPEFGNKIPDYLQILHKRNILWRPKSLYTKCNILDYFCSHNVLKWGVGVITEIAEKILDTHKTLPDLNDSCRNMLKEFRKNAAV